MNRKYLYFMICSCIWGLTWIAIKFQLGVGDANVAVFYRFSCATVIMFALAYFQKQRLSFNSKEHGLMMAQGFFMFSLNFLLTYWASSMAPSALISLSFTAIIFFNMAGARLFLKMPLERKVISGAMISFVGMGLITYAEVQEQSLSNYPLSFVGFLIGLLGTFFASAGNIVSMKNRLLNLPVFSNMAYSMLYGSLFTLIHCLIKDAPFAFTITTPFLISFFYLTIFGTVISFIAYTKLLQIVGPSKAAFTSVVSPVIALVVSTLYEKMQWSALLTVGIVLCLLGNCVALISNSRKWN